MKQHWGFFGLLALIGGLAVAGCGGNDRGGRMPITVAAPAQPATAYPVGTPALAEPATARPNTAYPVEAPTLAAAPAAQPYPLPSEVPAAGDTSADAALIELAKKDLGKVLSVAADQITVVSSAYMDWPDSSLGCPKPGMAYAQVITPGYRIILEQAQKQYDYHTNLADLVMLCTP